MPEWHEHTEQSLIEYAAGHRDFSAPASMEMQRRLMSSVKELNAQSGRQARTMIALTWAIIGLTVALGIVGMLQLWMTPRTAQQVPATMIEWRGFLYGNVEAARGAPVGADKLTAAPAFSTLQDCVKWGRSVSTDSTAGFECSQGCRFNDAIGEVVCADSTRVMR